MSFVVGFRALRDILALILILYLAHQLLFNEGMLHRDISPGNILLNEDKESDVHGLLCDIEFALVLKGSIHCTSITTEYVSESQTRDHVRFHDEVEVKRGAPMTVSSSLDII